MAILALTIFSSAGLSWANIIKDSGFEYPLNCSSSSNWTTGVASACDDSKNYFINSTTNDAQFGAMTPRYGNWGAFVWAFTPISESNRSISQIINITAMNATGLTLNMSGWVNTTKTQTWASDSSYLKVLALNDSLNVSSTLLSATFAPDTAGTFSYLASPVPAGVNYLKVMVFGDSNNFDTGAQSQWDNLTLYGNVSVPAPAAGLYELGYNATEKELSQINMNITFLDTFVSTSTYNISSVSTTTIADTGKDIGSIVIADANNDGSNEVVIASKGPTTGAENWILAWNLTGGVWGYETVKSGIPPVYSIAVGDANNDGSNEIVAGLYFTTNELRIYNKTGGSWTETVIADLPSHVYSVAIGDADNDGLNEIVAGGAFGSNKTRMYKKTGGAWVETNISDYSAYVFDIVTLDIGDADNDGLNEVVAGPYATSVYWMIIKNQSGTWINNYSDTTYMPGAFFQNIKIGDANNDTKKDVLVCQLADDMQPFKVFYNITGSHIAQSFTDTFSSYSGAAIGDIDNDGYTEVALSRYKSDNTGAAIIMYRNISGAWQQYNITVPKAGYGFAYSVAVGDANNDGLNDVIGGYSNGIAPNVVMYEVTTSLVVNNLININYTNITLHYNGSVYTGVKLNDTTWSINITTPYIESNSISKTFFWGFTNNVSGYNVTSNYTQTLNYAFDIGLSSWSKNPVFEGDTVVSYIQASNLSSSATLANAYLISNGTMYIGTYSNYNGTKNYYRQFSAGATSNAIDNRAYNWSLAISYNGSILYRNISVSPLTVMKLALTDCGYNNITAVSYSTHDEMTWSYVNYSDYSIRVTLRNGPISREYSFSQNVTQNISVCVQPFVSNISADVMLLYSNGYSGNSYPQRTWYAFNTPLRNTTEKIQVYLLPGVNATGITVQTKNQYGVAKNNVLLVFQKYNYTKTGYVNMTSVFSGDSAQTYSYFNLYSTPYRILVYDTNNNLLNTYNDFIISSTSIAVGTTTIYPDYGGRFGLVSSSCSYDNNTKIVSCSYDDPNNYLTSITFIVREMLFTGERIICNETSEAHSGAFTCDLSDIAPSSNGYEYYLIGSMNPDSPMSWGVIRPTAQQIFGAGGLIYTALIIMTLFFVGIWKPVVGIVAAFAGLLLSSFMGMYDISVDMIGALLLLVVLLVVRLSYSQSQG
jgi:hypothetical protein